jgi:hypothetical protein
MPEGNIVDSETNSTVKHSFGYWAAVVAQWGFAIGAGVMALGIAISVIIQILKGGDILVCLVVLPHLVFFTLIAWLSGKLARNIQLGIQPPSASFSLNWVSALSLAILTVLVGGIMYAGVRQQLVVQERARVSEVVNFIDNTDSKQKAFSAKYGRQPASTSEIGPMPPLKYFATDNMVFKNNSASDWSIKFTRNDLARNRRYGSYAIVYNSSGTPHYDCVDSSHLKTCREELIPRE